MEFSGFDGTTATAGNVQSTVFLSPPSRVCSCVAF